MKSETKISFRGSSFANFRASVHAEMKSLQRKRIGSRKRQAEILTEEEELIATCTCIAKGLPGQNNTRNLIRIP